MVARNDYSIIVKLLACEQNLSVGSKVKRRAPLRPAFLLDPCRRQLKYYIEMVCQGMYITESIFHDKGNILFVLLFIIYSIESGAFTKQKKKENKTKRNSY